MALSGPISVKFEHRPLTVAVDATFALSHFGMLATLALSGHANVYLPRSLLGPLDNCQAYVAQPELLGGPIWQAEPGLLERLAAQLETWSYGWHFGRMSGRLNWLGDLDYESAPAAREDTGLRTRFEACAVALDEALAGGPFDFQTLLDTCLRDALALAAAVQPDPAIVLLADTAGVIPAACRAMAAAGLTCHERPNGTNHLFRPEFASAAAAIELAGGVQLEVLAPSALALPDTDDPSGDGCEPWDDARVFWRRLYERQSAAPTPIAIPSRQA